MKIITTPAVMQTFQSKQNRISHIGVKPMPCTPRFGFIDPASAIGALFVGVVAGAIGTAFTLMFGSIGLLGLLMKLEQKYPTAPRVQELLTDLQEGKFDLVTRTEEKSAGGRVEKQTRLRVGDREMTFMEIAADAREHRFFGTRGKAMIHYKLADDDGNLSIEYTDKINNKKQKRSLTITGKDLYGAVITIEDKKLPKNVVQFFDTLRQAIADAQKTAVAGQPITLFSTRPQLLDRDDIPAVTENIVSDTKGFEVEEDHKKTVSPIAVNQVTTMEVSQ